MADGANAGEIASDSEAPASPRPPEGDWLGICRDGIKAVEQDLADAATGLLAALLRDEHEIVTLVEGEGASAAVTRRITGWLAEHHPDVVAEVHHGGQPLYPYYLGIE